MGYWNHRILATEQTLSSGEKNYYFAIHEVHYEDNDPVSHTALPVDVGGESIRSITWALTKMLKARKKPILWAGDRFPEEFKENVNLDKLNV